MKKVSCLFIIALSFCSCSFEDGDSNNVSFEDTFLPIESVTIPSEFELGETYTIEYTYNRPSSCHSFLNLYQDINLNVRSIFIISRVFNASQCTDLQNELITRSFNITVNNTDTYIYKFWQGEDSNGEDIYLQLEIPVIE